MGFFDLLGKLLNVSAVSQDYTFKQEEPEEQEVIQTTPPVPTKPKTANEELARMMTSSFAPEPPELSVLLRTATPSKGGLYPHEILMLAYAHQYKTKGNKFQQFWRYAYSVKDPQSVLTSLCKRGFIEQGNLRSTLERLKVTDIKTELKQLNAKVSGKKADLIDRLLAEADISDLREKYKDRYYQLTQLGAQELEENPYVLYLHDHKYMSIWEMNCALAKARPGFSYKDILWGYFNTQSIKYIEARNYAEYRCTKLDMYQFLMERNKQDHAFDFLCEVAAWDLCPCSSLDKFFFESKRDKNPHIRQLHLERYEKIISRVSPYDQSNVKIPPTIVYYLANMQGALNLSDAEFKAELLHRFEEYRIPFRVFTNEECVEIILAEINQDREYLTAFYDYRGKQLQAGFAEYAANI